jgi:hypothetical protein
LHEKLADAKGGRDAGDWSKAITVMQGATMLNSSRDLL